MSDPTEFIARAFRAPFESGASATTAPGIRLIGKPHGLMRCVNLSLTPDARDKLYARAWRDSITLGEALMDALDEVGDTYVAERRPGRTAPARRGVEVSPVYVLLTSCEAANLADEAHRSRRSLSDFASRVLAP